MSNGSDNHRDIVRTLSDSLRHLGSIVVLATGGTIAQVGDRAPVLTADDLVAALPGRDAHSHLVCEQVFQVASPDVMPEHWLALARRIRETAGRSGVAGIVVTHGTDTIEETAYHLNLVLDVDKPVVLVGSMRPAGSIGADGLANLGDAIAVAASPLAANKGVLVTLNGRVEGSRDVTKTHATALDAFRSASGPLGHVEGGVVRFDRAPLRRHTRASAFAGFDADSIPRVDVAYCYAGVDRGVIDFLVSDGCRGIVIAGTGNGSVPRRLEDALRDARRAGVVVVRSSRTNGGTVIRNAEHDDDRLGLLTADDLNPQKARVLLALALAYTHNPIEIQEFFDEH